MSELSWLLDLLLNHGLDDKTKKHVGKRIAFVEKKLSSPSLQTTVIPVPQARLAVAHGAMQSPSTIAAMQRHAQSAPAENVNNAPEQPVIPAATVQAAQALESRRMAIAAGMTGKPEPGRTSPRKF